MDLGNKISRICELEGINLKQFSTLVDIPYNSLRSYMKGRSTPNILVIQKITDHPRFAQYTNLLMHQHEPVSDSFMGAQANEPDTLGHNEFNYLIKQAEKAGVIEEAMSYLRYLIEREDKK